MSESLNQHRQNELHRLLGSRIRTLRRARGWSLARVAGVAGLSKQVVSRIELGHGKLARIEAVASALGVPIAELFRDVTPPRRSSPRARRAA